MVPPSSILVRPFCLLHEDDGFAIRSKGVWGHFELLVHLKSLVHLKLPQLSFWATRQGQFQQHYESNFQSAWQTKRELNAFQRPLSPEDRGHSNMYPASFRKTAARESANKKLFAVRSIPSWIGRLWFRHLHRKDYKLELILLQYLHLRSLKYIALSSASTTWTVTWHRCIECATFRKSNIIIPKCSHTIPSYNSNSITCQTIWPWTILFQFATVPAIATFHGPMIGQIHLHHRRATAIIIQIHQDHRITGNLCSISTSNGKNR